MDTGQIILIAAVLLLIGEVTYLVVKLPRRTAKLSARSILVDTSVLIDGRIVAVAKSGFIGGALVVPRSVIGELQFLADNADHEKRARARYGLDVVTELQNIPQVEVEILQDGSKAEEGVDERLLKLAKKNNAAICTIDYNLNKVAVVEGITVVNVNELAQSLRMSHLPGERMKLELVQKGQDAHQGVGYLPDGTMVVVEHANKFVGKAVEIEFIRSLQTAAGKMMFARLVEQQQRPAPSQARQAKPAGKKPTQPKQHAARPEAPKGNDQPERQPAPKQQNQSRGRQERPKRVRTQKDREAALIELVDKQ